MNCRTFSPCIGKTIAARVMTIQIGVAPASDKEVWPAGGVTTSAGFTGSVMTKLSDIADLRAGYTQRKPPRNAALQEYFMIHIRDVARDEPLDLAKASPVALPQVDERYLLRKGDVLFAARGERRVAVSVPAEPIETMLVGSQFFVIAPDTHVIRPAYLAWYLNTDEGQRQLTPTETGSYIAMLRMSDVAAVDIPIPPLDVQDKIVEFAGLIRSEKRLAAQLADLNARYQAGRLAQWVSTQISKQRTNSNDKED